MQRVTAALLVLMVSLAIAGVSIAAFCGAWEGKKMGVRRAIMAHHSKVARAGW